MSRLIDSGLATLDKHDRVGELNPDPVSLVLRCDLEVLARFACAEVADYEGYQYVPTQVESDLSGGQDFPRSRPHPKDPSGTIWDEDKVAELYPKLAAKYDYNG